MSKGKGNKGADPRREERRRAQLAQLRERAAAEAPAPRREHIEPADVKGNEQKYEPLLYAIESGLVAGYDEREALLMDDEAERALRLLIARYEGDTARRSGSADVDLLAARVDRNIDLLVRRQSFSPAEIIGGLRRVIESVRTHHDAGDPRAYFEFVSDFILAPEIPYADLADPSSSQLWTPGGGQPVAPPPAPPTPSRPSGLWLPGDER